MRQAAELNLEVTALRAKVVELRGGLFIKELECEKLLRDKILLAQELRDLRRRVNVLTGRDGPGSEWDVRRVL